MSTQKPVGQKSQKNPDDAEIEEIMSEIEVLQKEMRSPVQTNSPSTAGATKASAHLRRVPDEPAAAPDETDALLSADEEEDILKEFRAGGGGSDGGLEDNLVDLKGEDTGKGILDEVVDESVVAVESETDSDTDIDSDTGEDMNDEEETTGQDENGESGTLSMTLTGNMTLKLKYATEGQEVAIGFGDGALTVKLADGTEFKIPVRRAAQGTNTRRLRKAG